ncbi:MAG: hypothetical protein UU93_C0007G0016 [Candidatus Amesbacteria bacterium GW2011_GWA2_42_12]|uniref:PD(D/E)XK endonuclease domain-containing protein n=1 Tax=Candidatus Amesbacteria bacterium GW2011_GWA2_42_12 TaxID=1618356 RepID=A0A0G1AE51_9BACT|nr:MAG: hypothetical protein UU93_C0007G0016 [Candidatus Amesbacteria bacterium GW2011_GWA2_42_12]
MYGTHDKGVLGELAFTYHLIEKGYTVLSPINPNSSYDLAIEKNGKFTRIQVKYRTPVNGILRIELDRPMRKTKKYFERDVDAMGLYNPNSNKFYLVPLNLIKNKDEFWLRVEKPKGLLSKKMHLAEEFEI